MPLKLHRRGFLGAILAIPLAGWTGFRAGMAPNWLKFPIFTRPIPPISGQIYINWLFEKHLDNVRRQVAIPMMVMGKGQFDCLNSEDVMLYSKDMVEAKDLEV